MSEASHKKVIVIGDGHVGKTCFVAKVTENKFIPNYLPTMGVEFGVKSIRRGNHEVKLKLWDIAGIYCICSIVLCVLSVNHCMYIEVVHFSTTLRYP
jgi:small GTP-binding protein